MELPEIKLIKITVKNDAKPINCFYFLGEVLHLDGTITKAEPWMTREEIIKCHWPETTNGNA